MIRSAGGSLPPACRSWSCARQAAVRDVEPDDLLELAIVEQALQEPARAATQVEHALGAAGSEHGEHGVVPLFVEAELTLRCRLLGVVELLGHLRLQRIGLGQ